MKIDGIKLTIGIDTLRDIFKKKEKRKLRDGEIVEILGYRYQIYDVDEDGFSACEHK